MQVKVRRLLVLEGIVPEGSVELPEGSRLRDLIRRLEELYGPRVGEELIQEGRLRPDRPVLIGGRGAAGLGGLDAPLRDGVEVVFLVPLAGGASPPADLGRLEARLRGLERVSVAFSGGVDSGLVLAAAARALGPEAVLALTADAPVHPRREVERARSVARWLGVPHLLVPVAVLDDPEFSANPVQRCYLCKLKVFGQLQAVARERGFDLLVDGANASDASDFRPGQTAAQELGVVSPLLELGLGKPRIRELARVVGLPHWALPPQACLATRFPFGRRLTAEALAQVESAEDLLLGLGLSQVRVRHHGDTARIEVLPEERGRVLEHAAGVAEGLRSLGFRFVALDLDGYRPGSLNPG
ncbi:MAG: ATP-dependent sacrificial sulfur transferase LarE [Acetobacteraceae bacterium]|nr:ATP-dependent sacrificial sulfur transferase LarE [Acetobacteraceae bacterium]